MALQLGEVIGKIGGGGGSVTVTDLNTAVSTDSENFQQIGNSFTVGRRSLVAVMVTSPDNNGSYWGDPAPSVAVLKSGAVVARYTPSSSRLNSEFPFQMCALVDPGTYTVGFSSERASRTVRLGALYLSIMSLP